MSVSWRHGESGCQQAGKGTVAFLRKGLHPRGGFNHASCDSALSSPRSLPSPLSYSTKNQPAFPCFVQTSPPCFSLALAAPSDTWQRSFLCPVPGLFPPPSLCSGAFSRLECLFLCLLSPPAHGRNLRPPAEAEPHPKHPSFGLPAHRSGQEARSTQPGCSVLCGSLSQCHQGFWTQGGTVRKGLLAFQRHRYELSPIFHSLTWSSAFPRSNK